MSTKFDVDIDVINGAADTSSPEDDGDAVLLYSKVSRSLDVAPNITMVSKYLVATNTLLEVYPESDPSSAIAYISIDESDSCEVIEYPPEGYVLPNDTVVFPEEPISILKLLVLPPPNDDNFNATMQPSIHR